MLGVINLQELSVLWEKKREIFVELTEIVRVIADLGIFGQKSD
jgi:hypothetical protein